MPVDYKRYPPNWKEISRLIRFDRAAGCCEWCGAKHLEQHPITGALVILTVAHLGTPLPDGTPVSKTNTMDCRPENLACLCQRCHLNFDRPDIIVTQRRNRIYRRLAAAQQACQLTLIEVGR